MSLHPSTDTTTHFSVNQSESFRLVREQNRIWNAMRETGWTGVPAATHEETKGERLSFTSKHWLTCHGERFRPVPDWGWGIYYWLVISHHEGARPVLMRTVGGRKALPTRAEIGALLKAASNGMPSPYMGDVVNPHQDPIPTKVFSTTPDPQRSALKPVWPAARAMPDLTIDTHASRQVALPNEGFRPRSTLKTQPERNPS